MTDHWTPNTADIRKACERSWLLTGADFDRWLASTIRAAQAEARDGAAAALEGVVDLWRSDPDNWRFETVADTRNWLMDVASDMRAGRPIVLTEVEATDV